MFSDKYPPRLLVGERSGEEVVDELFNDDEHVSVVVSLSGLLARVAVRLLEVEL